MISINAIIFSICFAKFTNPIRDVTDIRRISAGSGGRCLERYCSRFWLEINYFEILSFQQSVQNKGSQRKRQRLESKLVPINHLV